MMGDLSQDDVARALGLRAQGAAFDPVAGRLIALISDGQSNGVGSGAAQDLSLDLATPGVRQYIGDLGAELLPSDVAWARSTSGWTASGCTVSVATGRLVATVTSGSNPYLSRSATGLTAGHRYLVRARCWKASAGASMTLRCDSPQTQRYMPSADPTEVAFAFTPSGTSTTFYLLSATATLPAGATFGAEYLSVREILDPGDGDLVDIPDTIPVAHPEMLAGYGNPTPINAYSAIGSASCSHEVSAALMARGARGVIILPGAVGGSSLVSASAEWGTSGTYYLASVARVTRLRALFPDILPIALFSIGESDTVSNTPKADFKTALISWVAGMRAAAGAEMPVILGSMTPEFTAYGTTVAAGIEAAKREVAQEMRRVAYVLGPSGMSIDTNGLHYSNAGQRVLGQSMAAVAFR